SFVEQPARLLERRHLQPAPAIEVALVALAAVDRDVERGRAPITVGGVVVGRRPYLGERERDEPTLVGDDVAGTHYRFVKSIAGKNRDQDFFRHSRVSRRAKAATRMPWAPD